MSDQMNVDRVAAAWGQISSWLAEHAPLSSEALLPPAPPQEVVAAEQKLRDYAGHGFPAELKTLWSLCGGLQPVDLPEEDEDDGDLNPHGFIPEGNLLSPQWAVHARLRSDGFASESTPPGIQWVPFLGEHWEGGVFGRYVDAALSPSPVGRWDAMAGLHIGGTCFASIADLLEQTAEGITHGGGPLVTDRQVPGLEKGCLAWGDPREPLMLHPAWRPLH
ncbi:hypothetical protein ACWGH5_14985 [Streptomyces sp. NPDC054864]